MRFNRVLVPVHEFYGLKASQMSKVHASSHGRATHMLKNQESSGTEFQRYSGPQLSQQKNQPNSKKKNLTAERITMTSWQKK